MQRDFITVKSAREVEQLLRPLESGSVIFLDVDDTLITPKSNAFRPKSPHRHMIDDLKKNREMHANFDMILSQWRLKRSIQLVDESWPNLIKDLQAHHRVFALTKMESGSIWIIDSLQEWRFGELSQKGIQFSQCPYLERLSQAFATPGRACFEKGIFYTGRDPKGEVVKIYLNGLKAQTIVLVDDVQDNLLDMAQVCHELGISFLGVLYEGAKEVPGIPDLELIAFQKEYLIKNAQWLEDHEAQAIMAKNPTIKTFKETL